MDKKASHSFKRKVHVIGRNSIKTTSDSKMVTHLLDGIEHLICWHDDALSFPLNFTAPLLIESGFPYSSKDILHLDKELHPAENDYLKKCLEIPSCLKLICRDTVRRYFTGHETHKWVDQSHNNSKSITDFILMKKMLININWSK